MLDFFNGKDSLMLNVLLIKQAIIQVNENMTSNDHDPRVLYLANAGKVSLDPKPYQEFLNEWYGKKRIDELVKALMDKSNDHSKRTHICKTLTYSFPIDKHGSVKRDIIFVKLRNLSLNKRRSELKESLLELSQRIKNTIKDHCNHCGLTRDNEHEVFAQQVINRITCCLSDSRDDTRIDLFHIDDYKYRGNDAYQILAILSVIALIPNDANSKQMNEVKKFANAIHALFATSWVQQSASTEKESRLSQNDIWLAGKQWYEETKAKGNRFSTLLRDFDSNILPLVGDFPIDVHTEDGNKQKLMSRISCTSEHLYLIGEGGIGKTTALYSIMRDAYDEKGHYCCSQIPIFIELSQAYANKDFDMEEHSSSFIRHDVQRQLQNVIDREINYEKEIVNLFSKKKTVEPEFVLLLDGLNEVSHEKRGGAAIVAMVIAELCEIMTDWKNVRVILTSRSKENTLEKYSLPLKLCGIEPGAIKQYLSNEKVSDERIEKVIRNKRLMEVLCIPLFLTLYAKLSGEEELLSRGEILHAFFTQKKNIYNERSRAIEIRVMHERFGFAESDVSVSPQMLSIILDFIMTSIAWNMAKKNDNQISEKEINRIIISALRDIESCSLYGKYGKECINGYSDTISIIAKKMIHIFAKGADCEHERDELITKNIRTVLVNKIGVLVVNKNEQYEVIHQYVRDYFAALYHINKLKLASYLNTIEKDNVLARVTLKEWKKEPIPSQVLKLIGESLGEVHNAPEYDNENNQWIHSDSRSEEQTLVERGLDIFRKRFDTLDGYVIWNLFQILKLARIDLSDADLSDLDLSNCHANGYKLANRSFAANVKGSRLTDSFFMSFGHSEYVHTAHFDEKGKYIVTASSDKTAKVWNTKTYEEVSGGTLTGHSDYVTSARFSRNGKYIVTASRDKTAKVWSAKTFKLLRNGTLSGHTEAVTNAEFSYDDKYIVTSSEDKTVKVWDVNTLKEVKNGTLIGHTDTVTSASFSRDGKYIVSASLDGTVQIWNTENYTKVQNGTLTDHTSAVLSARFSNNGEFIVTSSEDRTAKVWRIKKGKALCIATLAGHTEAVNSAEFSPDGKYIVTASNDKTAKVWDASSYKEIPGGELIDGCHYVHSASYSTDGKYIVTTTWRETKVWDALTFTEVPGGVMQSHFSRLFSAIYSPNGNYIAIACREGTAKIWDAKNYKAIPDGILKGHKHSVYTVRFSPDERFLVTASGDKTAKVWDANTFMEVKNGTLKGHSANVNSAEFSPSGDYILTASTDKTAKVWDAENLKEVKDYILEGHSDAVNSAEYSPNGKFIVTASLDKTAKVWNATMPNEKPIGILKMDDIVSSAVFSSDSKTILTADHTGTVIVWKVSSDKKITKKAIIKDPGKDRTCATYDKNMKSIATASWGKTAIVWNVQSNNVVPVGSLSGHLSKVSSIQFSPDGKRIITSSWDNTAIIWNLENYVPEHIIHSLPGLEIWNIDIRNLHESSQITDRTKRILKEYGAIVD